MATTTGTSGFAPPRAPRTAAAALILAAALLAPAPSAATEILPGFDLFQTTNAGGSSIDLGAFITGLGGLPVVPLVGDPSGPGNTDAILQRSGIDPSPFLPPNPNLPGGSTGTVDVEIVALSLTSVAPVDIGGRFFDVFVTDGGLGDTTASTGVMTVRHETAGGGTYDLFIDFMGEKVLSEVGNPSNSFNYEVNIRLLGAGTWSHQPPPFYPIVPNLPSGGLYSGPVVWTSAPFQMSLAPAQIPEPASLALFALGLAGLGFLGRRRFKA